MEEEDIIIIDDTGAQRNAVIVRRPQAVDNRGGLPGRRWPLQWTRPQYPAQPVYQPPVYHPPAPMAPTVTTVTTANANSMKNWIPDIIDILAAVSPLPAPPVATGDPGRDFANAMTYAGALAASFKRADLLHTAARVIEKRL